MVPDGEARDGGADRLDDAGSFMAQHGGQGRPFGGDMPDHQVGVAHADTGDADEDLVPAGFGQVQWLDGERGLRMAQDRGAGVHVLDTPPGSGKRTWRSGLRGRRKSDRRSDEHTSELQSLMRISYSVFCFKKQKTPV